MHSLSFVLFLLVPNLTAYMNEREVKDVLYCNVKEEHFSYRFNFNNLTNNNEDYVIKHEADDFLTLQLCKALKKSCNGLQGYAVCHSREGKEYGIGKEPPEVLVKFGEITFKYIGDKCDNSRNYTVNVKMICDYAAKENNNIEWFPSGYNDCNFNVEWRTIIACTDEMKIPCTINDKLDHHYDLSPLINLSDNYKVYINKTHSVILNICHSILYRSKSCISNSAACLVDKSSNSSINLGLLSETLKFTSDGSLSLTYDSGAICTENIDTPSIKTIVTFICNLNATGTLPKYNDSKKKCHYDISWETVYACSLQEIIKKSTQEKNDDICSVKDPRTNHVYDFKALMNKDISVYPFGQKSEIYKFRVCAPINNTKCKNGSGACKIKGALSGGMANAQLLFKEKGPYLNYTNGDLCEAIEHQQMYTVLEFYCSETDDCEIDEKNELCHDVIKIGTKLACNREISTTITENITNRGLMKLCTTITGDLSLEQFMLESKNYVIKTNDNTEYHINVCKSLVKEGNLNCPDTSAACKVTNVNGKLTNPINLGNSGEVPIPNQDKSALLLYHNGSICEENKNKKLETSISFLCSIDSDQGFPTFYEYRDCTYKFTWETNVVCGVVNGNLNNDCTISNSLGDIRDLSTLNELLGPNTQVTSSKSNKKYYISFCGENKHCNGSYVCDDKKSYGTKTKVLYDYATNSINVSFTEGSKCKDGSNAKTKITLVCSKDDKHNLPILKEEDDCLIEFQWQTSRICRALVKRSLTSRASLTGGEIVAIVVSTIVIALVLCYLIVARRSTLTECISNSTSRNCDRVKYSRVNTTEEVHLLMNATDPTVIETDSDDDLLEG